MARMFPSILVYDTIETAHPSEFLRWMLIVSWFTIRLDSSKYYAFRAVKFLSDSVSNAMKFIWTVLLIRKDMIKRTNHLKNILYLVKTKQ